ncbi:hypothetical protein ONS96_004953 [Cadophora gregata f. sp. sojae]|nr:hypothetical protein ONS96_004953 [Cadophora gregata f. sp. sojae]
MQSSQEIVADAASMNENNASTSTLDVASVACRNLVVGSNTGQAKNTASPSEKTDDDAESKITSPGAKVLQTTGDTNSSGTILILKVLEVAQTAGFSPVAIPGNLLARLLTSMNNLQTQVSTLKGDVLRLGAESSASKTTLAHTRMELKALKDELCITKLFTFPLFPKLPLELRLMI